VLPLVTILRGQGLDRVVAQLRAPLLAIQSLADDLKEQPDVELCHQPDTGILCFRLTPAGVPANELDALQRHLYDQVLASGERSISITTLNDQTVLRLVVVSPHTTLADLQETIAALRNVALRKLIRRIP
jgi:L-2,4-diaminobutyrate decarboxylase